MIRKNNKSKNRVYHLELIHYSFHSESNLKGEISGLNEIKDEAILVATLLDILLH